MAEFTLDITGTSPLLMHSARLSDPLDDATRALSKVHGKRKKTEDDHRELARLEHLGSLYFDESLGPFVPGANIEACLFRGASKYKLMSALKSAMLIPEEVNPLVYKGPRSVVGLWEDKTFVHRASVKVGTNRVIRTRPVFTRWALTAAGSLDTEVIDPDSFEQIVETSGRLIGLGDWRPRFGRFEAEVKWL
jgi:hypothetical protein